MGPSRSSSLRISDDSSTVAGSRRVRDAPIRSAAAKTQNAPGAPPFPLDKDKGKINLIKYPGGSDYLKLAVQHAVNVGPSKVGPSYGVIFAERYRPPPGVRIWTPDVSTFIKPPCLGWFIFLKSPLTMVFVFHCTPSQKGFCNISTSVLPNSLPTVGVF